MQIKINKASLKDQFLYPISKVIGDDATNKGCILELYNDKIQCLCNTADGSVILQAIYNHKNSDIKNNQNLNIFDLRKLIKILDCIPDNEIVFDINANNISYSSPQLKFKFHLMDDGVIKKSIINTDKIRRLNFDCEFVLTSDKINEINRLSTFTEETNKIYISCQGGEITGELTDKTKPNIDNVTVLLANSFNGNSFNGIALSLDVLRKFSGIKFDSINTKINTQTKIFSFELISNECILNYISTALVK